MKRFRFVETLANYGFTLALTPALSPGERVKLCHLHEDSLLDDLIQRKVRDHFYRAKRFLIVVMLFSAGYLHAASVKSGNAALRQLVVVPVVNLQFGYFAYASREDFLEDYLVPAEIEKLRKEVRGNPENAERLLRLGELLNYDGKTNDARVQFERAEKSARKKSDSRPADGLALVSLADALDALDRDVEAESLFRRATQVSSNEWKCWTGLGRFLGVRAQEGILPKQTKGGASLETIISAAANYQPSPEVLARSELMRKESVDCFNRAVLLAPNEPDVYLGRANIHVIYRMMDFLGRFYRDKQPVKPAEAMELYCSVGTVRDLKEAARLCPDDERIVATAAWFEISRALLDGGQENPNFDFSSLDKFPEKARDLMREAMNHLEALSATPDKRRSSGALMNLGILKITTGDFSGAKVDLRRAVALEPAREKAWEALLSSLTQTGTPPEELVKICEGLVKSKNSARNRLMLAKALMKQNKLKEAKVQIKAATELEPENILPYLFAAAVSLKLSSDETYLAQATAQMTRANQLFEKIPTGEERRGRLREHLLNAAILSALVDQPDQAKEYVNIVLKEFPDDETAKDILSAIE